MCGRFTLRIPLSVLNEEIDLGVATDGLPLFDPKYNMPPTTAIPVVRQVDNRRTLSSMRWVLLPSWTKDVKKAPMLNNARAETMTEKPSFRYAFESRRCLIPASGFFEWKTEGKAKQPYYFLRPDDRPLALAVLWERCGEIDSCTIITTEANEGYGTHPSPDAGHTEREQLFQVVQSRDQRSNSATRAVPGGRS